MSRILKLQIFTCALITLIVSAVSCKKSDVEGSTGLSVSIKGPGIYVAGVSPLDTGVTTHIWKDGQDYIFKKSQALAMTSNGSDVYVAGFVNYTIGVVWKNGIISYLQQPDGASSILDIAVAGSDVYVIGADGKGRSCYWKNGVPHPSSDTNFLDLAASGNDIYMIGTVNGRSACWKNGTPIELNGFTVYQISVSGQYVHFLGRTKDSPLAFWKNGQITPVEDREVRTIAAKGPDIYAFSTDAEHGRYIEKNGVKTILDPDPVTGRSRVAGVSSIFVDDNNDIYLAGGVYLSNERMTACYWKNGVRTDLSNIKGSIAIGISVIK